MSLTAFGVNHKTAPISVRERLAFHPAEISDPLQQLVTVANIPEAAILSTCNRLELICTDAGHDQLLVWLAERHRFAPNELAPHVYCHQGESAVRHLIRVASGLDSMMVGEPQILGQMKLAFQTALSAGTVGPQLKRLFPYIFASTKLIRSQTGLGNQAVSIAFAAVKLAKHIFTDLTKSNILMLGAGETVELVLRHLTKQNVHNIWLADRTEANAESLAYEFKVNAIPITEIPNYLVKADIIISAMATPLPVVGKGAVESAVKLRRHRPMLFIDLGLPRNIEPEIAQIPDVYLYCLDDMQKIVADNLRDRKAAGEQADQMIDLQVEHFMRWLNSFNAVATIRTFREKINKTRDLEIKKALRLLHLGHAPEDVIYNMATALSNKIMHAPSIKMRIAGYNDQKEILACARYLFDLSE